ncbi:MAG: s-methyl-5-thioribose-1-phosphate isomerase, partial [Phascolarctobacterium sp.]|nr:s-methyl-5-thioribose-1-phosphate isomerase [Phascolarctobacterium sp.]
LATCGWGTALGVVREAHKQGKLKMVYADETRPLLQGARLTAYELVEDNIPVTVITDGMAAWTMKTKGINAVVVGADRIAANGDTANKIGTYGVALAAKAHGVPFYIAAPTSTFDFTLASGEQIPIEERSADEVKAFRSEVTAPTKALTFNPSFDVTPAELIAGIITEYGVVTAPYKENIKLLQAQIKEEL